MGGSCERMTGLTKGIFNAILLDLDFKQLTHETLTTLITEVCSISNSRPLMQISFDPGLTEVVQ